jgi:hypothetical protein
MKKPNKTRSATPTQLTTTQLAAVIGGLLFNAITQNDQICAGVDTGWEGTSAVRTQMELNNKGVPLV